MKLLFATHNPHKAQEIRDIFLSSGSALEITSLVELGDMEEIIESGDTLVENALIKAREGYARHGLDCFADDTGLEVEALDGRPGVYSARYAGLECRAEDNIQKLLGELQGIQNRSARFRTVVALILMAKSTSLKELSMVKLLIIKLVRRGSDMILFSSPMAIQSPLER